MCALSLPVLTVLAAFSRINTWVAHEDWSALMDTIGAVRMVSMFLLVTTLLINLLTACAEGAIDREIREGQDLTI